MSDKIFELSTPVGVYAIDIRKKAEDFAGLKGPDAWLAINRYLVSMYTDDYVGVDIISQIANSIWIERQNVLLERLGPAINSDPRRSKS